mgnify:CR=1 FL=1
MDQYHCNRYQKLKIKKKKIDKVDNLKAQALLDSIEYDF